MSVVGKDIGLISVAQLECMMLDYAAGFAQDCRYRAWRDEADLKSISTSLNGTDRGCLPLCKPP